MNFPKARTHDTVKATRLTALAAILALTTTAAPAQTTQPATQPTTASTTQPTAQWIPSVFDQALEAHGGLDAWQAQGTLEFDLVDFPLGEQAPLTDHNVTDLRSRAQRITSDDYTVVFDGHDCWVAPGPDALGLPPRYYAPASFYFLAMPFVWADPGVSANALGTVTWRGEEFDAVQFSYGDGVGDTHEDEYVALFDPKTHRVRLIHFIQTYAAVRGDTPINELERTALVYDEYQQVNGLQLARHLTIYGWENGDTAGEGASYVCENVELRGERPDPALFTAPEGAVLDTSHGGD